VPPFGPPGEGRAEIVALFRSVSKPIIFDLTSFEILLESYQKAKMAVLIAKVSCMMKT